MTLIRPGVEYGIVVTQPMHQGSGARLRTTDEKQVRSLIVPVQTDPSKMSCRVGGLERRAVE